MTAETAAVTVAGHSRPVPATCLPAAAAAHVTPAVAEKTVGSFAVAAGFRVAPPEDWSWCLRALGARPCPGPCQCAVSVQRYHP